MFNIHLVLQNFILNGPYDRLGEKIIRMRNRGFKKIILIIYGETVMLTFDIVVTILWLLSLLLIKSIKKGHCLA